MKKTFLKRGDWIVLAALVLLALTMLLLFLPRHAAQTAVVRYRGEEIDRVRFASLQEEERRVYHLEEGEVTVCFSSMGVSVVASPCRGGDCIHTGTVEKEGAAILCAPLGFSVTLSGESDTDGITG